MRAITTVSAIVFLVTPDTRVATAYILNRVEDGEYGVAIAYGSIPDRGDAGDYFHL